MRKANQPLWRPTTQWELSMIDRYAVWNVETQRLQRWRVTKMAKMGLVLFRQPSTLFCCCHLVLHIFCCIVENKPSLSLTVSNYHRLCVTNCCRIVDRWMSVCVCVLCTIDNSGWTCRSECSRVSAKSTERIRRMAVVHIRRVPLCSMYPAGCYTAFYTGLGLLKSSRLFLGRFVLACSFKRDRQDVSLTEQRAAA